MPESQYQNPGDSSRRTSSHSPSKWLESQRSFFSTFLSLVVAALVLLPLLGHKALAEWDEGIYAEVSREMLKHSLLIPQWNYQLWLEKPPLMLWITACFYKLFAVNEFWARAGSALSGVAIIGILHRWLIARKDIVTAWISTLLLLATFGYLHVCRVGEMDVLLSLGCCIALWGLNLVQQNESKGWYVFWAGFAVAAMTKGAASVVLLLTLLLIFLLEQWWKKPSRFGRSWWLGVLLFLLVVLPWHLYMFHLFGRLFIDQYLGFHVLARATTQIEGHASHWWYYLNVLFVSAAPFVLVYPFAIVYSLRRPELRIWGLFSLVVLVFFTLVQTRLPHYIAPAYPSLTLISAAYIGEKLQPWLRRKRTKLSWMTATVPALAVCILSALLTAPGRHRLREAKSANGTSLQQDQQSITLLRRSAANPQLPPGPLLLWHAQPIISVATDVFYSRRHVQQVQLNTPPPQSAIDKYIFNPMPIEDAVSSQPGLILLDSALVQQIPTGLTYKRIEASQTEELGSIARSK